MPADAGPVTRTLQPGVTYFSAAEICVVLLPVGEIPDDAFFGYASLVMTHRQVELNNVRSFYKESQKSPLKFFPWKTGTMNFRFLSEEEAMVASPLTPLHAHRRILGVIGLLSMPHSSDVSRRYKEFEQRCRSFPDASTIRCLAFDPGEPSPGSDAHSPEDARTRPDLIVFPPGQDIDHLKNHMEVVMHDFAACMLGTIEGWMLNASPAMVSLSTFLDAAEFTGTAMAAYAGEDDAGRTKRKYGRLQKALGDYALLAGSPLDALDHYTTAADLGRSSGDWTWAAAAMEGYASAKLLHAALSTDAYGGTAASRVSVFHDDGAWRTPRSSTSDRTSEVHIQEHDEGVAGDGDAAPHAQQTPPPALRMTLPTQTKSKLLDDQGDYGYPSSLLTTEQPRDEGKLDGESLEKSELQHPEGSEDAQDSGDSSIFGGSHFWRALRSSEGLESEVRLLREEARVAFRRRGGLPLLVEADVRWARLLVGLHGQRAKKEVLALAGDVQSAAELLPLPEDRLVALTEAAAVLGAAGAGRKRVLLLWQAVELSKYFGFPDAKTLAVARRALEPVATTKKETTDLSGFNLFSLDWPESAPHRPLDQNTAIPASWSPVKAGCLEAALGLAIYAKRHADVWDAAAALLRDHASDLSTHRMQSLLDNLMAASSQMSTIEKNRPGRGPPPILLCIGPCPLPAGRAPVQVQWKEGYTTEADGNLDSPSSRSPPGLFLYDPFAAKRRLQASRNNSKKNLISSRRDESNDDEGELLGPIEWVCGEMAAVDVEVSNPSAVNIKIDKLVLEAAMILPNGQISSQMPNSMKSIWKPKPVSINIPAYTKPVRVRLEGTPLVPGMLAFIGCRLTAFGGVTWLQTWTGRPEPLTKQLAARPTPRPPSPKHLLLYRATVLPALPQLRLSLRPLHHISSGFAPLPGAERAGSPRAIALYSGSTDAAMMQLLLGQSAEAELVVENVGNVPVTQARVGLHSGREEETFLSKRNSTNAVTVDVEVDTPSLQAALPLDIGASVALPVRFTSSLQIAVPGALFGRGLAADIVETYVTESLALDYCGPVCEHSPSLNGKDDHLRMGRRALAEVALAVGPSLLIMTVEFQEAWQKIESADFVPGMLMLVEVLNSTRWALRAGVVDRHGNSQNRPGNEEDTSGCEVVVLPGQTGVLPFFLPVGCISRPGQETKGPFPAHLRGKPEEQERYECATLLLGMLAICFIPASGPENVSPPCSGPGQLPLTHGDVLNGLTLGAVARLRRGAVTAKILISPTKSQHPDKNGLVQMCSIPLQPLLPFESSPNHFSGGVEEVQDSSTVSLSTRSNEWCQPAVEVPVGAPVHVTLQIESNIDDAAVEFGCSLTCLALPPSLGVQLESSPPPPHGNAGDWDRYHLLPGTVPPAPVPASGGRAAAWTGVHSRVVLQVPPQGTVRHAAGLLMVRHGVYRIGISGVHATVRRSNGTPNGLDGRSILVDGHPGFINVVESTEGTATLTKNKFN